MREHLRFQPQPYRPVSAEIYPAIETTEYKLPPMTAPALLGIVQIGPVGFVEYKAPGQSNSVIAEPEVHAQYELTPEDPEEEEDDDDDDDRASAGEAIQAGLDAGVQDIADFVDIAEGSPLVNLAWLAETYADIEREQEE